ncbi:hypothetical protein CALCODRAFT_492931 [Calocera cornea HHB12733]|uniref:Uncharacterized protein n=1 Tax=Calocera cornea HHB12733 TaxID=1353952 RepID=A0A165HZL7_9BASI|nr:hypothetical protein CALCODRAFT_492931 [Calocera cornea HHB12733]
MERQEEPHTDFHSGCTPDASAIPFSEIDIRCQGERKISCCTFSSIGAKVVHNSSDRRCE